ncbi:hypothetical protein NHQ30_000061 [Ciborinia camelliae]|nr:hypothetical protein NHQ30_000061 [Ciborinia camelliae]
MPGSPPELTGSKSSSFHSSYQSDNDEILSDVSHFEEIGLDDESRIDSEIDDFGIKMLTNPYSSKLTTDLRSQTKQRQERRPMSATQGNTRIPRDLTSTTKGRPGYPTLRSQIRNAASDGLAIVPVPSSSARTRRGLSSPNAPALPTTLTRQRSLSPNILSVSPRSSTSGGSVKGRRGSWISNRERKTIEELENECDEDDGDDVPDECLLENVPISPRPLQERTSAAPSASTSPERPAKEKSKPLGNGTSSKPAEQGELRSPRPIMTRGASAGQYSNMAYNSNKPRAKSWNEALSDLSEEAKALTEALEAHADDEVNRESDSHDYVRPASTKPTRVKSSLAELPPLRRTELMIDPLPISKEKEAVLSRTRPSWLPPKDPAEERRHLKEYQKMMASAEKVELKKESEKRSRSTCRDDTASSLLKIWEEHVLPNWDDVIRQRRTRELWWRGIAPRSRGAVWARAIGNPLGLTNSSYTAALRRAQALETTIESGSQLSAEEERKKGWLERIERDVKETYPELRIFQPEGPLHVALTDVLKAYSMYRSDVGYVHGTSTIAAILLLNLPDPSSSFQALSNILNRPLPLSFHTNDPGAISRVYSLFLTTLSQKFPSLHSHLSSEDLNLNPDVYLRDTFTSLFTSSISLDNASRLWDIAVFEGDGVLVRAAVGLFGSLESKLHGVSSDQEILEVLQKGIGAKGVDGEGLGEEDWVTAIRGGGEVVVGKKAQGKEPNEMIDRDRNRVDRISGSQLSAEEERKKGWLERIERDVKETYPELRIFQPEGPLHVALTDVLKAYSMYRSDVGYVHGTSTIAAILLLNLPDPSSSFQALSNILNRPLPLSFHTNDPGAISRVYSLFLTTLSQKFPSLHSHLSSEDLNLNPDVYLRDTFTSLFTSSISLDNASRLWDIAVFEGDGVLVRAAVGLFGSLESKLHGVSSDQEILEVLQKGIGAKGVDGEGLGEEDWVTAIRGAGKS